MLFVIECFFQQFIHGKTISICLCWNFVSFKVINIHTYLFSNYTYIFYEYTYILLYLYRYIFYHISIDKFDIFTAIFVWFKNINQSMNLTSGVPLELLLSPLPPNPLRRLCSSDRESPKTTMLFISSLPPLVPPDLLLSSSSPVGGKTVCLRVNQSLAVSPTSKSEHTWNF